MCCLHSPGECCAETRRNCARENASAECPPAPHFHLHEFSIALTERCDKKSISQDTLPNILTLSNISTFHSMATPWLQILFQFSHPSFIFRLAAVGSSLKLEKSTFRQSWVSHCDTGGFQQLHDGSACQDCHELLGFTYPHFAQTFQDVISRHLSERQESFIPSRIKPWTSFPR